MRIRVWWSSTDAIVAVEPWIEDALQLGPVREKNNISYLQIRTVSRDTPAVFSLS